MKPDINPAPTSGASQAGQPPAFPLGAGSPLVAVPFNVNEYVRVKLTERGKKCLRENYDKLAQAWGGKLTFQFRLPEEDADGWSRWQMWSLMQDLGPHISMGSEPPFETSIEVLANSPVIHAEKQP